MWSSEPLTSAIPSPAAAVTPALVHIAGSTLNDNNGINGNTYIFNGANATLAGNCLVLTIAYPFASGRTISISDSTGDTWPAASITIGTAVTGNMRTGIYVLTNASAGMHILTVTFDALLKPFQYTLAEFNNITAVDGTQGTIDSAAPNVSSGSFTPSTNNDANGGHLIFTYALSDDTVGGTTATQASAMSATNSAKLLHADNSCTIPSVSSYSVQATNGAINPGFSITQSTPKNFLCSSVALKAGKAGSAPAAGIRVIRVLHCTLNAPATGDNVFLFPCDGNLRIVTMGAGNNLNTVNSVTDSASQTYTSRGSAGNSQVFDRDNATPSNALTLTMNLNAAEPGFSVHLFDVAGAAASAFDTTAGFNGSAPNSTTFNDFPDITPLTAPGLMIVQTGLGTASQGSLASGAPAGAVFGNVSYTTDALHFDQDHMDNADPFGHVVYSTAAAQTWNWHITSDSFGSTAFATACSYKAA